MFTLSLSRIQTVFLIYAHKKALENSVYPLLCFVLVRSSSPGCRFDEAVDFYQWNHTETEQVKVPAWSSRDLSDVCY